MRRTAVVGVLDLGASGGRFFAGVPDCGLMRLVEVHRFVHHPITYYQKDLADGRVHRRLCWNTELLYAQLMVGLRALASRPDWDVRSFGIDTWGSDGGWLSTNGDLLGLIGTGRDPRWIEGQARVLEVLGAEELFTLTGAQSYPYNVLNQIVWYLSAQPSMLDDAAVYLPVGSYLTYLLTGEAMGEYTWMSTTQLCRAGSSEYSSEVLDRTTIPADLLPRVVRPGTDLGPLLPAVASEVGLADTRMMVSAQHDTACAFEAAATSASEGAMIVSSGTWSLAGMLVERPQLGGDVFRAGFTNEAGVRATRLQKNLMGTWPAQQLRMAFSRQDGREMGWDEFGALAEQAPAHSIVLDVDDPSFYAPDDMIAAIISYCERTDQPAPRGRAALCRSVYEGLAMKTAFAATGLADLTGRSLEEIVIVGGGARNALLNQWIAGASGLPVRTGSADATALGNAMVQAEALGLTPGRHSRSGSMRQEIPPAHAAPEDWSPALEQLRLLMATPAEEDANDGARSRSRDPY